MGGGETPPSTIITWIGTYLTIHHQYLGDIESNILHKPDNNLHLRNLKVDIPH